MCKVLKQHAPYFIYFSVKLFFQYTQKQGNILGIRGWIMNTSNRTVKGQLEGECIKIERMKNWLQNSGSPSSRIDKAVFSNEKSISEYSFDEQSFQIRH